ncbi:MAG: hypothetical protein WD270_11705 [Acetobacterales bacterium]
MRRTVLTAALLAALTLPAMTVAAVAQTPERPAPDQSRDPAEMAEEAARQLIQALQLFFSRIPQYELPEMLPNGDIIIRRINPPEEREPEPEPEPDEPERADPPVIDRT